nr:unnamed protein product [Spirometra erinaceieuropaei]
MATVESILKQTGEPDEATHLIRQQVTSLLMAHKSRAIITKEKQNALKALRNDTSIVILPADKGRSTDLAIETIQLLLQSKCDKTVVRLGHAQILHLLKLCLRTYFTFDGTIYEQVKGKPMGSPIPGFINETVLQWLESLIFQHHKTEVLGPVCG